MNARRAIEPRPETSYALSKLMAEVFPTVPLHRPIEGRGTLLAIDRARRVLGHAPAHRWEDVVRP